MIQSFFEEVTFWLRSEACVGVSRVNVGSRKSSSGLQILPSWE